MCRGVEFPGTEFGVHGDDILVETVSRHVCGWVCFFEQVLPPGVTGLCLFPAAGVWGGLAVRWGVVWGLYSTVPPLGVRIAPHTFFLPMCLGCESLRVEAVDPVSEPILLYRSQMGVQGC